MNSNLNTCGLAAGKVTNSAKTQLSSSWQQSLDRSTDQSTKSINHDELVCKACDMEAKFVHEKMIPCTQCRLVFYCNEDCKEWDWSSGGHKNQCVAANSLSSRKVAEPVKIELSSSSQQSLDYGNDSPAISSKAEDLVCNACDMEAKFVHEEMIPCTKCRLVFYCNKDCKEWDWSSGGHKNKCESATPDLSLSNVVEPASSEVSSSSLQSLGNGNDLPAISSKTEELVCNACDMEAKFVHEEMIPCSTCRLVFYCNKDCKEWDWSSGGHKNKCESTAPGLSAGEVAEPAKPDLSSSSQQSLDYGNESPAKTSNSGELVCQACGMEATYTHEDMIPCTKCRSVFYCNKDCKQWDWSSGGHKNQCKSIGSSNHSGTSHREPIDDSLSQASLDAGNLFQENGATIAKSQTESTPTSYCSQLASERPANQILIQIPDNSAPDPLTGSSVVLRPSEMQFDNDESHSMDILNEQSAERLNVISEESYSSEGPVCEASWRRKVPFMKAAGASKNIFQNIAETVVEESEEDTEEASARSLADRDKLVREDSFERATLVELMDSKTSIGSGGALMGEASGILGEQFLDEQFLDEADSRTMENTEVSELRSSESSSKSSHLRLFREVYNSPLKSPGSERGVHRTSSASSLRMFRAAYNANMGNDSIGSTSEHGTSCTGKRVQSFLGSPSSSDSESSFSGLDFHLPIDQPKLVDESRNLEPKPTSDNRSIHRARERLSQSKAALNNKLVDFEQKFGEKAAIAALDGLKDQTRDRNETGMNRATVPETTETGTSTPKSLDKEPTSVSCETPLLTHSFRLRKAERRGRENNETGMSESSDKAPRDESISVDFLSSPVHVGYQRQQSATQNSSVKSVQDESISIEYLAVVAEKNQPRSVNIPQYMQYRQALARDRSGSPSQKPFESNGVGPMTSNRCDSSSSLGKLKLVPELSVSNPGEPIYDEANRNPSQDGDAHRNRALSPPDSSSPSSKPPSDTTLTGYAAYRSSLTKKKSTTTNEVSSIHRNRREMHRPQYEAYRKSLTSSHTSYSHSTDDTEGDKDQLGIPNNVDGQRSLSAGIEENKPSGEPNAKVESYETYRKSLSQHAGSDQEPQVVEPTTLQTEVSERAWALEEGKPERENYYSTYRRSLSRRCQIDVPSGEVSDRSELADMTPSRTKQKELVQVESEQEYVKAARCEAYRRSLSGVKLADDPSYYDDNSTSRAIVTKSESSGEKPKRTSYEVYRRSLIVPNESPKLKGDSHQVDQSDNKASDLNRTESKQGISEHATYENYRRSLNQHCLDKTHGDPTENSMLSNDSMEQTGNEVRESYSDSKSEEGKETTNLDKGRRPSHEASDMRNESPETLNGLANKNIPGNDESYSEEGTKPTSYEAYRKSISFRSQGGQVDESNKAVSSPSGIPLSIDGECMHKNTKHVDYESYRRSLSCNSRGKEWDQRTSTGDVEVTASDKQEKPILDGRESDQSPSSKSVSYEEYRRSLSSRTTDTEIRSSGETVSDTTKNPAEVTNSTLSGAPELELPERSYEVYRRSLSQRKHFGDQNNAAVEGENANVRGYETYRNSLSQNKITDSNNSASGSISRNTVNNDTATPSADRGNTEPAYLRYRQTLTAKNATATKDTRSNCAQSSQLQETDYNGEEDSTGFGSVRSPESSSSDDLPEIVASPAESTSSVTSNSESNPAVAAAKTKYAHMTRYLNYRLGLEAADETAEITQTKENEAVQQQEERVLSADTSEENSNERSQSPNVSERSMGKSNVDSSSSSLSVNVKALESAGFPPDIAWGDMDASMLFSVWQEVEGDRTKLESRLDRQKQQEKAKKVSFPSVAVDEPAAEKKKLACHQEQHPTQDIEAGVEQDKHPILFDTERRDDPHPILLCCRYTLFLLLLVVLPVAIGLVVRSFRRQPVEVLAESSTEMSDAPLQAPISTTSSIANTSLAFTFAPNPPRPSLSPVKTPPIEAPTRVPIVAMKEAEPESLLNVLDSYSADNGKSLRVPGTPQFLAYLWLLSDHNLSTDYSTEKVIQRYAMATFFYSTDGENWTNSKNWLTSEDECSWYSLSAVPGSRCNADGFLTNMDLSFNDLGGSLPLELGLLSHLETLSLMSQSGSKEIVGTLPTTLGDIRKLSYLNVRGNSLVGRLPTELGLLEHLQVLDLGMNSISLPLPSEFGSMPSLRVLNLELNNLTGAIPTEVNRLAALERLMLGSNRLTGVAEINGALTSLKILNLEQNRFTSLSLQGGPILGLETLTLYDNDLKGSLPSDLGEFLSLRRLSLHSNHLEGPIPTELGQLDRLTELNLAFNQLTGQIPSELGSIQGVGKLELQSNLLIGGIPTTFADLSALSIIRLDDNELSGEVPGVVCDSFLQFLPSFYLDCGANEQGLAEVACPANSCCSFCCVDGRGCQCAYDDDHKWLCFNR